MASKDKLNYKNIKDELKNIAESMAVLNKMRGLPNGDYDKIVSPIFHLQNKIAIIEKDGEDKYLEAKENTYYLEDNLRRFFLADMLRRKSCLKKISIEDLDNLVDRINTLVSNLSYDVEEGKQKLKIEDKHNHSESNYFQNIVLHNVLDLPVKHGGSTRDFKNKLKARWGVFDKEVDKL